MGKTHRYMDRTTGLVKTAPKQGRKQKPKDVDAINAVKDICLYCERPVCNGCSRGDFTIRGARRKKRKEGEQ